MKILESGRAIIVGFEEFDLKDYPNLEVVGCNATSTEHLDFVREAGIKVIDLKGETEFLQTITSTSEHTIGLMIALARNYKEAFVDPSFHDREDLVGYRLAGKTLGVVGFGRIGKRVCRIAESLGMATYYY